jgi:hypothetical protein
VSGMAGLAGSEGHSEESWWCSGGEAVDGRSWGDGGAAVGRQGGEAAAT